VDGTGVYRQYFLPRAAPIRPILGFWGAKFPKIGDSLPRTPLNHHAKFDAASFILAGEIRNRTNTHTNKQTVNDISTVCLAAFVDNNLTKHKTAGYAQRLLLTYPYVNHILVKQ